MDIGKAIKEIRKKRKIPQNELAINCKISQTYLSQIENNKIKPNLSTLEKIGQILGVPIPVILFQSLTDEDVSEKKRELFNLMSPTIDNFINDKSPFKINHRKTFYKIGSAKVTGVITKNNVLDVRNDQKEKLKSGLLTEAQKSGLQIYIDRVKKN